MNQKLYLTFDSSLLNVCEVNSSFDRGVLRICYPGENRNGSFIDKEDLTRCVKTLFYVPVVGNYIRDIEDFGGHDVELITKSDGALRLVNKTQPVGVVPADANVFYDTIVDENGDEKEYLFTDVLLWKRQEAYQKIKEEGVVSHSMEITVKSGETIDGVFHIYDFEFTALCLLGAAVEPCFEDSALEVFSGDDFKAQFELMMNDFKESFGLATTSTEDQLYSQDDTLTKGGEEDLSKNINAVLFVKDEGFSEPQTAEFEDESVADGAVSDTPVADVQDAEPAADEQAEADSISEEASENEPDEVEPVNDETADNDQVIDETDDVEEDFVLNSDIEAALFDTLWSAEQIADGDYIRPRYWFVDFDSDSSVVYFNDVVEDWRLFGCDYSMNGDNVVIDFDTKRRMKYTIVEFDEGTPDGQASIFANIIKDADERCKSIANAYEAELTELREFRENVDASAMRAEREAVLAEFADLAEIEEFVMLRENANDFDVETLREKCYAIRGKNVINPTSAKFSASTNMPVFPVGHDGMKHDEHDNAPYGGVVEYYKERAQK